MFSFSFFFSPFLYVVLSTSSMFLKLRCAPRVSTTAQKPSRSKNSCLRVYIFIFIFVLLSFARGRNFFFSLEFSATFAQEIGPQRLDDTRTRTNWQNSGRTTRSLEHVIIATYRAVHCEMRRNETAINYDSVSIFYASINYGTYSPHLHTSLRESVLCLWRRNRRNESTQKIAIKHSLETKWKSILLYSYPWRAI